MIYYRNLHKRQSDPCPEPKRNYDHVTTVYQLPSLHLSSKSQYALSIPQVCMFLPQVLRHLISTTISCSVTLRAARNWAEVKSLPSTVNGVLVAGAVRVTLEALGAAELGAREALYRR